MKLFERNLRMYQLVQTITRLEKGNLPELKLGGRTNLQNSVLLKIILDIAFNALTEDELYELKRGYPETFKSAYWNWNSALSQHPSTHAEMLNILCPLSDAEMDAIVKSAAAEIL